MIYKGNHKLGDFFTSRRERGTPGLPMLSVTMNNGVVTRESLDRKMETNLSDEEHLLVRKDDIVYNMMRMWQGASGLADRDGLLSPAYVVLAPKKGIDPLYASYLFKSSRLIYLLWAYSYGLTSDRLRLYFNDFKRIPVNIPSLSEQRKIGKILFTWDQAISTTEKILSNSRQQKKALMQQLLKGGRRLPEFQHSKWQKVSLSELVEINYGKSPATILCEEGLYPVIGTGGINGSTNTAMFAGPSVVIGRKGTIDQPQFTDGPFWAIDTTFYCVPKNGCDIKWFYYLSRSLPWKLHNEGSGVPSLSRDTIGSIRVLVPRQKEQEKIAQVLTLCEKDIEKLETDLRYLKNEKKALMQQLLTGKRRVKVDES